MPLQLVARDGTWLVFNQVAFRQEVVAYLWGPGFEPTINELYSQADTARSGLELPDDHWALAQTAFAARADLLTRIRPDVRRLMDTLPDRASSRAPAAPDWVPAASWRQFLADGDGVHRYARASRFRTDIILIKRNGVPWAGYCEMPTDEFALYGLLRVSPAGTLQRLMGAEMPEQARVRWLADANRGFNHFMWLQVSAGVGPAQALRNYREAVHQRFLAAYLPLIGAGFPHPAGTQLGDALRAWNVIPGG